MLSSVDKLAPVHCMDTILVVESRLTGTSQNVDIYFNGCTIFLYL